MTPHYDSLAHAVPDPNRSTSLRTSWRARGRALANLGWIAALACLLTAPVAFAAEPAEPDTSYLGGEVPGPMLDLTLDQALKLGTENSPSGRSAMAALHAAEGSRLNEAGNFDPVLFGAGRKDHVETPVSSPFESSKLVTRSLTGGLSWLSPIGTGLSFGLERVQQETDAPFTTLPTSRSAHARLDFVQPLLKGFGLAATRGELRARDQELEAAREQFAAAEFDVAADVENAYWALYAAEQRLDVQRKLRQRAAAFLRDQILRGRAGVIGPGDVATARTFLAEQETALLDQRVRVGNASDLLAEVLGIRAPGGAAYHVLDIPPPPAAVEPLEVVMARAIDANPTLQAFRADSAAAHARERQSAYNAWPTLEAFGGYGASGLAGVGRQIVFGADTVGTAYDRGFGYAWDQVQGRDYPDWTVGLRVVVPIGWRSDRGEHQRQQGLYEEAREALRARQLALETLVRTAHREAEISQAELDATLVLVSSNTEQVRISRLEYQAGRGTAYDLVNQETDLASARLRETEVRVRIAHAATELRRLTTPAPGRNAR